MGLSAIVEQKLKAAIAAAQPIEKSTLLWTSLQVAQWALESGWGAHQPGNNCFGIKASSRSKMTQLLWTTEYIDGSAIPAWRLAHPELQLMGASNGKMKIRVQLPFAAYDSLTDCFSDHADLLTKGYQYVAFFTMTKDDRTADLFIKEIGPIYASAPNYPELLQSIITEFCLGTYDRWWEPQ